MKDKPQVMQINIQNLPPQATPLTEMVFAQNAEEEEVFHQKDLIRLEVYGISLNPDPQHPVLILKDSTGAFVLSVLINPLEAGVTLTQSNKSIAPVTPHRFVQELIKSLNIEIVQCVFVQIKGSHQYVRLYLKGHPDLSSIKLRADEVMSLVLHLNIPIYASRLFIEKSRVLNLQIAGQLAAASSLPQLQKQVGKTQNYII